MSEEEIDKVMVMMGLVGGRKKGELSQNVYRKEVVEKTQILKIANSLYSLGS